MLVWHLRFSLGAGRRFMNAPETLPKRKASRYRVNSPLMVGTRRALAGYGRALRSSAIFAEPTTVDAMRAFFSEASSLGLKVACRGSGRSYGDAALNRQEVVLSTRGLDRILGWDPEVGVADLECGVTIEDLWRRTLKDGYWPAVAPGTMFPTMGGCVAMNVHGKNHFAMGAFGDHVLELDLLTPTGDLITCGPTQEPELFRAVVGGLGLLGVTTRIRLRLKRIASGRLAVQGTTTANLQGLFDHFEEQLPGADYLVGWVDAFARGKRLGRSVIHQGYTLADGEDPDPLRGLSPEAQDLPQRFLGVLPRHLMWRFLRPWVNRSGMRLLNLIKLQAARFSHRKPRRYLQSLAAFTFLLDYIPRWRDAYGSEGFIQVQPFIPKDAARAAFETIITRCQAVALEPFLAVFKRHRADEFLLSHALDGYSLAMDFRVTKKNRARLWALGQEIGDVVVAHGGRFYFAKDALTRSDQVLATLGSERLAAFEGHRARCDPERVLSSELSRRVLPPPA